jgi:CPA2 family monovalent cation:H+ antiporter-2
MGEFAFIIAKVALDAGLVNLNFYSSVIGAALITMLVLPLISKSSAKIVDWSVSILPRSLLRGFGRINELKAEVRKRLDASSEVRNRIKTELFLILIDLVLIVSVQIVFDLMITADNPFRRFAQGLGIAPLPFLFLLGLILITPAVFNTMIGIRRIATIVASSSGGSVRRKESEVFIYKLIKNIGNALMGAMLVLLFIPFISIMGDGFPTALLFLLASWLVLLYFSWKSYKSAYDRVCSRLSRSVMEDINRED